LTLPAGVQTALAGGYQAGEHHKLSMQGPMPYEEANVLVVLWTARAKK
jgi:hypothetical protein